MLGHRNQFVPSETVVITTNLTSKPSESGSRSVVESHGRSHGSGSHHGRPHRSRSHRPGPKAEAHPHGRTAPSPADLLGAETVLSSLTLALLTAATPTFSVATWENLDTFTSIKSSAYNKYCTYGLFIGGVFGV